MADMAAPRVGTPHRHHPNHLNHPANGLPRRACPVTDDPAADMSTAPIPAEPE
jgi:hypothetical protein